MRANESTGSFALGCPQNGTFWICTNKEPRFIGCCRSSPCKTESGVCPDNDLEPATFAAAAVDRIPEQACVSSDEAKWYACDATSPPFLGCCATDACEEGACNNTSLRAARLSRDVDAAELFLSHGNVSVVLPPDPTSVPTATATATARARDGGGLGLSRDGLAALAVALIAVLGAASLSLVAFLVWRRVRRRRVPAAASGRISPATEASLSIQSAEREGIAMQEPTPHLAAPEVPTARTSRDRQIIRERMLGQSTYSGPFEDEWGYPER